jgi:hypothetical protein
MINTADHAQCPQALFGRDEKSIREEKDDTNEKESTSVDGRSPSGHLAGGIAHGRGAADRRF